MSGVMSECLSCNHKLEILLFYDVFAQFALFNDDEDVNLIKEVKKYLRE